MTFFLAIAASIISELWTPRIAAQCHAELLRVLRRDGGVLPSTLSPEIVEGKISRAITAVSTFPAVLLTLAAFAQVEFLRNGEGIIFLMAATLGVSVIAFVYGRFDESSGNRLQRFRVAGFSAPTAILLLVNLIALGFAAFGVI